MSKSKKENKGTPDEKTEQQIRFEEAKKSRIEAEAKFAKQEAREVAREQRRQAVSGIPMRVKMIGGGVLILLLIVLLGVVAPLILNKHETEYFAESDLKEAVNIESLSAIDYVYRGIAEKPGNFLWMEGMDYRVKYVAHVRANYNMSEIEFSIDRDNQTVVAYLPDAEIGSAVLDENGFSYLPESANADIPEILALCKEDAASDINTEQMQKEAFESLKNTVQALTMPILGDSWSIDFKKLSEFEQERDAHEVQ